MSHLEKNVSVTFICLIVAISTVNAQGSSVRVNNAYSQSKSDVPTSIDRQFRRDAARLALRLDSEKDDVRYLPIGINRDNLMDIAACYGFTRLVLHIYIAQSTIQTH